jgi:hypothetical protein
MAKRPELMQEDVEIIEEAAGSETVDVYSEPTVWKQRYSFH